MTDSGTLLDSSVGHLSSNNPLVLATTLMFASNSGVDVVVKVLTVLVAITVVLRCGNPETRLPVEGLVLAGKVDTLAVVTVAAALRESARSLREFGGDGGVLRHPVGKGILAVLDDAIVC